ncbi:MAG: hypothetical protein ABSF80_01770 [Chitinispirillaceae bacterium]|jgi:hypothetical protein
MSFKSRCFFLLIPVFALVSAGGVMASVEKPDTNTKVPDTKEKVSVGGYSFWQIGQIVKGFDRLRGNEIAHQWQNNVLIGLFIKARPSERLSLVISPEFYMNYPYPQQTNLKPSMRPFGVAYTNEAYGNYSFGDLGNPLLQASLGMFDFKYNRDGTNFGDYLFRTGTYPTYIFTNFDFPAARLLGLHLSSDAINNFHADLLLTSEAFVFPLFDFSLAGIASYKLFNAIEIGAGIDFARCFPANDSLTSPKKTYANSNGVGYNSYITPNGDTAFYSFKATKVMARAAVDPKPFLGSPELFGPEDLKLYGEICWVGVEGGNKGVNSPDSVYHAWYNSLNQRTPRMVGFNFPAFRILDVLSGELEYFPSVLPNDYTLVLDQGSPVPHPQKDWVNYNPANYNKGSWRWSVYAKKMVVQGFSVIAEFAFDHLRTTFWDGSTNEYESLTQKGHWHWNLKFGYSF